MVAMNHGGDPDRSLMDEVLPLGSQVLTDHRHGSYQGAIAAMLAFSATAKDAVSPHIISHRGDAGKCHQERFREQRSAGWSC